MNRSNLKLALKVYSYLLIYVFILGVLYFPFSRINILSDFAPFFLSILLILVSPTIILYMVLKHFDAYPPKGDDHVSKEIFRSVKNVLFDLTLYSIAFLSLLEIYWNYALGKSNYIDLIYLIIALIASVLVAPINLKIALSFKEYLARQMDS